MTDVELKGGYTSSDPRLDRIPQFDEASRNFPIRAALPELGFKSRSWVCPPKLDQGSEGACVGFAWTHGLAADPGRYDVNNDFARSIYRLAQTLDEWPGEQYSGTSVLAGAKAIQQNKFVTEYRWAFGIDDVLETLSNFGPVVVGTWWLDSMFKPGPDGLLDCSGSRAGGHAYLIRGLLLKPRIRGRRSEPIVRGRNSWGAGWGMNGDFFMTVEDLERLLLDQGEACVPTEVKKKRG